jgi:hypothetical protein
MRGGSHAVYRGKDAEISSAPSCFVVVARLAQRLPICLVPKQLRVAAMSDDVIDHFRDDAATAALALGAEPSDQPSLRHRAPAP